MSNSGKTVVRLWVASFAPALSAADAQEASSATTTNLADMSIEQLMEVGVEKVYGASKREQKVTQAPAVTSRTPFRRMAAAFASS